MPAAWSFDALKRFSGLNTLDEEGAKSGEIGGRGYYKYIEAENDRIIADSKVKIDDYKDDAEQKIDDFESDLKAGRNPSKPELDDPPKPEDAKKLNKNEMSRYVTFLNTWMIKTLDQIVLTAMFCFLIIATLLFLRNQDVG